jgi:NO-binding membrane sensor protein with MHYT domain
MLDPFIIIPAIAIGYWSDSLPGLAKGLGIWTLLVQCVAFLAALPSGADVLALRLAIAAAFGGLFYLAGGARRRWRHGQL